MDGVDERELAEVVAAYASAPSPLRLHCGVQHYAWGDPRFIPALLGCDNAASIPYAELWMGDHPDLPASVTLGQVRLGLDRLLALASETLLGGDLARRSGARLPYLFKVLAAARPLSIQVHPDRHQAAAGFARENEAGLARAAPTRCYKDPNHKPELIAALTDFYALRGFRPLSAIAHTLARVPELAALGLRFEPTPAALRGLYAHLMRLPQDRVDAVLGPLVERVRRNDARRPYRESEPEHWVLQCDPWFGRGRHKDRGLFSIYLFNLIHLRPGEALYLPARMLHAYLRGAAVEIMANSNNVLRGGLTDKHVDVGGLLDVADFEGGEPEVLRPVGGGSGPERVYQTPAIEFELAQIALGAGSDVVGRAARGAEILIVVEAEPGAEVRLVAQAGRASLARGEACLVPYGLGYRIEASGPAVLYRARPGD